MPSALTDFSSLVATLYDAAAEPQQWAHFVTKFYQAMSSSRGALIAVAADPNLGKMVLEGYTASEIQRYNEYYCQHDVVVEAGMHTLTQRRQWIGPLEEVLPEQKLEQSEIYNDHYRGMDMHYATCLMMAKAGPYSALGLAAWRPKSAGPYKTEQVHLVELLAPHLERAFVLHSRLMGMSGEIIGLHSALDATNIAVISLGADGKVLSASVPAEAILMQAQSLVIREGKLRAINPEKDRIFQRLIHDAIRTAGIDLNQPEGRVRDSGDSVLLPQRGSAYDLQVQVLPVRLGGSGLSAHPAALVFAADPGAVRPTRARTMRDLYHLTPVESRLADLFLQGEELKEAAGKLNLSYDSARFHLKQIFRKTSTRRQTELLRLLLTIPA